MDRAPTASTRSRTLLPAALVTIAALCVVAAGCGSGGVVCPDGNACTRGDATVGHDTGSHGPLPTDLLSLFLMPQDATIDLPHDAPTVTFVATGRQRDGRTRTLTSGLLFSIDNTSIGAIDPHTGVFTASGMAGGVATVRCITLDGSGVSATAMVTVNLHIVVLGPGVNMTDPNVFTTTTPTTTPATAPSIDYPLTGAVMPSNVYPPNVMWTPHHPSPTTHDLWRVQLARPHTTLEGYFLNASGFTDNWQIATANWPGFSQSEVGSPINVTVSVYSNGIIYQSGMSNFRTVDAVLGGSVYYWSPPHARLMRLDVQPAQLVDFLPNPGDSCIGCHAVSRDGTRLTGVREPTETVTGFDITRDLTANPAPNLFAVHYDIRRCESFNPDAAFVVTGDCGANPTTSPFGIIDMSSGNEVTSLAGMAGDGFDPEWSPDGNTIAFSNRNNDLAITPVMPGNHFGSPMVIHSAASSPDGAVDWHPTWTPDSQWLVYQHGDTRRTHEETGSGLTGVRGALWIIAHAGGTPVRLDNLNSSTTADDSYRPIFSPFNSGGYFWLLFTSLRDYGNAPAGVHGTKQVWVAAISNHPDGTHNPAEVPYYLAGQEVATILSPYWAPPPCRMNGAGCSSASECCSGACDPDSSGMDACAPPHMQCRARGESCGGASDCCTGLTCTPAHICDHPPPG